MLQNIRQRIPDALTAVEGTTDYIEGFNLGVDTGKHRCLVPSSPGVNPRIYHRLQSYVSVGCELPA